MDSFLGQSYMPDMSINSITELPFMKMHGLGNDFVVVDARANPVEITPAMARGIGHRQFAAVAMHGNGTACPDGPMSEQTADHASFDDLSLAAELIGRQQIDDDGIIVAGVERHIVATRIDGIGTLTNRCVRGSDHRAT